MHKKYIDCINEISADDLYRGLLTYGLIAERVPPIFTVEPFYGYCQNMQSSFANKNHNYIFFESMRHTNVPRSFGIPNPMAYEILCKTLKNHWEEIKKHFHDTTEAQPYKISRIHIRKLAGTKSLFKMNYENWKIDNSPETDILIGKKYVAYADISTCFPSIYTHSICWALVGKEKAKLNREREEWYNEIDHACRNLRNGETHGLLIGPHASNLLSEIILTVVDKRLLEKKYNFMRHIDDYRCYVTDYETAQNFLTDLNEQLRFFDLPLNYKKTKIEPLPLAHGNWKSQLNYARYNFHNNIVDYNEAKAYLDSAIEIMQNNNMESSILNYAIKVLSDKQYIYSLNAQYYCIKTIMHLAIIYPYLVSILEHYVFIPFKARPEDIELFTQILFQESSSIRNYEGMYYALYFSMKYNFKIENMDIDVIIKSNSCLLKLFAWLYYKKNNDKEQLNALSDHARDLAKDSNDFDSNWLFVYESLTQEELHEEWKPLKRANISFILPEYR